MKATIRPLLSAVLPVVPASAFAGVHPIDHLPVQSLFTSLHFVQSLFPLVGLIAAVGFTQLLQRRRALQLKAIGVDRG